jgi:hypothetical protein
LITRGWARWAAAAIAVLGPGAAAADPAPFAPPDPAARVVQTDGVWTVADATCPTLPVDGSLRQRIVDVAAGEWARFGYQVEELRRTGLSVVARPGHGEIIPKRLNRVRPWITRRELRLGRMEDERSVAAAIGGYWATAPDGGEAIAIQNRLNAIYGGTGWAVPWSAAFVSYVVCAAGAGDLAEFRRSEGHWAYVDQAIEAADGKAPSAIYRARDIETGLPRPGDLVCLDRTGGTLPDVAAKRQAPGEAPLHCDIVVKVDAKHRLAAMIGGNVQQSVTMSLVNIVPARHGQPARLQKGKDLRGARPFFVVMDLVTGGTASLDATPAIRRIAGG